MARDAGPEQHEVIVIGAGQSGLAASYHLAMAGIDHVLLERGERVGDVWRARYDSLRLYSPARYDSLPGLSFPIDPLAFPSGHQMGDYLEDYVRHFELPVRTCVTVQGLRACSPTARLRDHHGRRRLQRPAGDPRDRSLPASVRARRSPTSSTPASRSCIRPTIATPTSSRTDRRWWSVPVTRARTSPSSWRPRGRRSWSAVAMGSCRSPSMDAWRAYAWPLMRAIATHAAVAQHADRTEDGAAGAQRRRSAAAPSQGRPGARRRRVDRGARRRRLRRQATARGRSRPRCREHRLVHRVPARLLVDRAVDRRATEAGRRRSAASIASSPGLYVLGIPFLHSFASMLVLGAGADAAHVVSSIRSSSAATAAAA